MFSKVLIKTFNAKNWIRSFYFSLSLKTTVKPQQKVIGFEIVGTCFDRYFTYYTQK